MQGGQVGRQKRLREGAAETARALEGARGQALVFSGAFTPTGPPVAKRTRGVRSTTRAGGARGGASQEEATSPTLGSRSTPRISSAIGAPGRASVAETGTPPPTGQALRAGPQASLGGLSIVFVARRSCCGLEGPRPGLGGCGGRAIRGPSSTGIVKDILVGGGPATAIVVRETGPTTSPLRLGPRRGPRSYSSGGPW